MNERELTTKLMAALRQEMPNCVIFKHADGFTSGVPDISLTWFGSVSWIEVKYANPKIIHREIQHYTMQLLAKSRVNAQYVVFTPQSVIIVHPDNLTEWSYSGYKRDSQDHGAVARWFKDEHIKRRYDSHKPRPEDVDPSHP